MQIVPLEHIIPVLQTAIGPVIMISGVGLLLLTMSNRLGRTIDRARILTDELSKADDTNRAKVMAQIHILWMRARLIRMAIALASMSALSSAILIIVLFFTVMGRIETAWIIGALFIFSMSCLIGSLAFFIYDINQSLAALKLELAAEGISDP